MSHQAPSLSVTLLKPTPEFRVFLEARIPEPHGPLILDEEDSTPAAGAFGGDLERHLIIPPESKDAVLLALLEQAYRGDSSTFSRLRELMDAKQIPYKSFTC